MPSYRGTDFAARGDAWMPVSYDTQDLRCLPDPMPREVQMFNQRPPCIEAPCSFCQDPNAYGAISATGGKCPSCKKEFQALLAGYASDEDKTVRNPLLYPVY